MNEKFNIATFRTMIKVRDFSSVPGEQNHFSTCYIPLYVS